MNENYNWKEAGMLLEAISCSAWPLTEKTTKANALTQLTQERATNHENPPLLQLSELTAVCTSDALSKRVPFTD